mmetsp:Transcript_65879/g.157396  ORF Transcript_65879/g.157396 Transcript_65879/m.157396 type:complete len:235 (+) Transcript_65879:189-893(+)
MRCRVELPLRLFLLLVALIRFRPKDHGELWPVILRVAVIVVGLMSCNCALLCGKFRVLCVNNVDALSNTTRRLSLSLLTPIQDLHNIRGSIGQDVLVTRKLAALQPPEPLRVCLREEGGGLPQFTKSPLRHLPILAGDLVLIFVRIRLRCRLTHWTEPGCGAHVLFWQSLWPASEVHNFASPGSIDFFLAADLDCLFTKVLGGPVTLHITTLAVLLWGCVWTRSPQRRQRQLRR